MADELEHPLLDHAAMAWSAPLQESDHRPLLVCLHGLHGVESDLTPLFDELPTDQLVAVSLRAPYPHGERFSWDTDPPSIGSFDASVLAVLDWLDRLQPQGDVGLAGFSQGGAMVVQLMRHAPGLFTCGALLAGFALPGLPARFGLMRPLPGDSALLHRRPPLYFGYGDEDDVIPAEVFAATQEWLEPRSQLQSEQFVALGHRLDRPLLQGAADFLATQLLRQPRP